MIQLLHNPVTYLVLFLLSMILSPKQWIAIIQRLLTFLIYVAFYTFAIPVTILVAIGYGIGDSMAIDANIKKARREELRRFLSSIDKLGKEAVKTPFLLSYVTMLKTPLIGHAARQGIQDGRKLQTWLATSQVSPNHRLTIWRPVRSFVRLIGVMYRRGYNYRRYGPPATSSTTPLTQNVNNRVVVSKKPSVAIKSHNSTLRQSTPSLVNSTPIKASSSYPTAEQIQRINTILP